MSVPERLANFEDFASSVINVLLTEEPEGDDLDIQTFDTSDGTFALGFRSEGALANFAGGGHHAAMPGRVLAELLSQKGVGLCLEPDADAQILTQADLQWLTEALNSRTSERVEVAGQMAPFEGLPEHVVASLASRAEQFPGLADSFVVLRIDRNPVIGVIGARGGDEAAIVGMVQELLTFSGEQADWSVALVDAHSAGAIRMLDTGHIIPIPKPVAPARKHPEPPGKNPAKPPILR